MKGLTPYIRKGSDPAHLFAGEVRGVVQTALASVNSDLRIRTQRPASIDHSVGRVLGDDLLRRLALLDPSLAHAHPVEVVGTNAAAAMGHARHHEQPNRIARR